MDDQRERILRAFGRRASRHGPGAVVMADLARELGISTKTLYKVFPSKGALVESLLERWAARLSEQLAAGPRAGSMLDAIVRSSEVWAEHARRFAPRFWEEVERDYPDAHAVFVEARRSQRQQTRGQLASLLRGTVPADVAFDLFDTVLRRAMDAPGNGSATTRRERIATAVDVWANGALASPQPPPSRRATGVFKR